MPLLLLLLLSLFAVAGCIIAPFVAEIERKQRILFYAVLILVATTLALAITISPVDAAIPANAGLKRRPPTIEIIHGGFDYTCREPVGASFNLP